MQPENTIAYGTSNSYTPGMRILVAPLAIAVLAAVLWTDMLTGPLRFYGAKFGMELILYLPKALCLLFFIPKFASRTLNRQSWLIVLLLVVYGMIGVFNGVGVVSVLFSVYLISPFLFGTVGIHNFAEREDAFVKVITVIFVVTAIGIFAQLVVDFPWKGFMYSIGDKEIEGSREWTTNGIDRIAGFARASSSAAFYMMCSGMFLAAYTKKRYRKVLISLVMLVGVAITTNKAAVGGALLGIVSLAVSRRPRAVRGCVYGIATLVAYLPTSTLFQTYKLDLSDKLSMLMLASFDDRLVNTWPNFLSAVFDAGNPVTGVGFGGVGSGVRYFASGAQTLGVADNFALYLYGAFGVLAFLIYFYFAKRTMTLFASSDPLAAALGPVMVSLLAASLTTDVIEAQMSAFMLGVAVGFPRRVPLSELLSRSEVS
jgi:hypothetical protein